MYVAGDELGLLISLVRKLSGNDLYKLFSSPVPLDALIKRAILFRLMVMEGGVICCSWKSQGMRCISWFGRLYLAWFCLYFHSLISLGGMLPVREYGSDC